MLTLLWSSSHNIYEPDHHAVSLHLHSDVCQLFLNKSGEKLKVFKENYRLGIVCVCVVAVFIQCFFFFFFLVRNYFYLFIYGCVGSSFLCEGFL